MGFLRGLTRAAVAGSTGYLQGKGIGEEKKSEDADKARKLKLEESREARDTRLDALRESLIGAQTGEATAQQHYYEAGAGLREKTDPNKPRSSGRPPAANASLMRDENYRRHFNAAKTDGMSDTDAANYARVRVGLAPIRSTSAALDAYLKSKTSATGGKPGDVKLK